eukprot:351515-Chlamydomonas_euryale.AAC.5
MFAALPRTESGPLTNPHESQVPTAGYRPGTSHLVIRLADLPERLATTGSFLFDAPDSAGLLQSQRGGNATDVTTRGSTRCAPRGQLKGSTDKHLEVTYGPFGPDLLQLRRPLSLTSMFGP